MAGMTARNVGRSVYSLQDPVGSSRRNSVIGDLAMKYVQGEEGMLGDIVSIDGNYRGVVVACLDRSEYSEQAPESEWRYLSDGIIVDTDFGGLVHYRSSDDDRLELIERAT